MGGAPVIANPNTIDDLTKLFVGISPQFGSGKSTQKTTGELEPGAASQEEALFGNILASTNPNDIDNMIGSILQRAKQAFGPAAIGSNAAGVRGYSDTVQESSRNEAMARATGEAAGVKLDAINKANATAANLTAARIQATKSTNVQSKTNATPIGKTLAVALAASALKKPFGQAIDSITGQFGGTGPEQLSGPDVGVENTPAVNANNPAQFDNATSPDSFNVANAVGAVDVIPTTEDVSNIGALTSPDAVGTPDTSTPVDAVADVPVEEATAAAVSSSSATDLTDLFDFADGGLVERKNYADGGVVGRKYPTLYVEPITGKVLPTTVSPIVGKAKGTGADSAVTNISGGEEGSTSPGNTAQSGTTAVGPSAIATAIGFALGGFPGAVNSAVNSAAINAIAQGVASALGTADLSGNTEMGAGFEDAPAGAVADEAAAAATGETSGETGSAADTSGSADLGAGGDSGSGDTGGGDGGGGDGGEAEGGEIHGPAGTDVIPIHVTAGEYVLPRDIVDMIGSKNLDKFVQEHHIPVRGRR